VGISSIDRFVIDDCFAHNPDGFGLTYRHPFSGELIVKRGMANARAIFRHVARHIEESNGAEMLLHFRFATHGVTDKTNCHPFRGQFWNFNDESGDTLRCEPFTLVHNGVIHGLDIRNPDWSDTREFVEMLGEYCVNRTDIHETLDAYSNGNRFAILHDCGQIVRFGKWNTMDGLHFSNLNWQWRARYKPTKRERKERDLVRDFHRHWFLP
jgi:predicted glutamine amidotransferase